MTPKSYKDVLDAAARSHFPDDTNFMPDIAARLHGRKSLMKTIRTRPLVAVLIALLILLALSGVVYALGKTFGYIPGLGMISQDAPLRVLAEPASITREGITMTVEEAVLSSDKTAIVLSVDGIPVDKRSPDGAGSGCGGAAELELADGSRLQATRAFGVKDWRSGYTNRFTFAPIPADASEATVLLPCIAGAPAEALPENWELPVRFAAAPPDMTVVPVVEVTPSPESANANALSLEKVIETENGYIFVGKFASTGLPAGAQAVSFSNWPKMTDASGQEVPLQFANYEVDLPEEESTAGAFPWALEIEGKQFNGPLTLTLDSVAVQYPDVQTKFEFDAGTNPQEGQTWNLDIDLGELGGYPVRVVQAIRRPDGYEFYFRSPATFHGIYLQIGDSTQGLTGMNGPGDFASDVKFAGEIPSGKLTVIASRPIVALPGHWELKWQPEKGAAASSPVTATPAQAPAACLTVDSWEAALANPAQIPEQLNKRVMVSAFGDNNAYIAKLDGSDPQDLGLQIQQASLSPDGARVAYLVARAEYGELYMEDLATGESHAIPNSVHNDSSPSWSPDGTRIAFMRSDDLNIYTIHPDGSNLQKVIAGPEWEQLVGWWPDGSALLYGVDGREGTMLRRFDLASGTSSDLFPVSPNGYRFATVSPDGKQIAFSDSYNKIYTGVYIAGLDGSGRRLVAQMSDNWVASPLWSLDGKWLVLNIVFNKEGAAPATALVNVETCQVIPLPISGTVLAWLP